MTNAFVEKLARACNEAGGSLDMGGRLSQEDVHELCIDMVRAVLLAAREPSEEMVSAIWAETGDPCWRENAIKAWQAAIDSALKD